MEIKNIDLYGSSSYLVSFLGLEDVTEQNKIPLLLNRLERDKKRELFGSSGSLYGTAETTLRK